MVVLMLIICRQCITAMLLSHGMLLILSDVNFFVQEARNKNPEEPSDASNAVDSERQVVEDFLILILTNSNTHT